VVTLESRGLWARVWPGLGELFDFSLAFTSGPSSAHMALLLSPSNVRWLVKPSAISVVHPSLCSSS
jgi:hypothetical protein